MTAGTEGAGSDPGPLSLADQHDGPIDPYMQVPGGVLHVPEQHSAPDVHGAPERKQQVQWLVPAGWHCCAGLGQRPAQVVPTSPHGVSLQPH